MKKRSTPASLPLKGQVTKHTTVKWTIDLCILIIVIRLENRLYKQSSRYTSSLRSASLFDAILE